MMAKQTPRIYFDYAAATPLDETVAQAMRQAEVHYGNPGSLHAEGRAAREALDASRADIARVLAARPDEIVFTASSTESNNLAIFGALTAIQIPGATVLTLATEHAAVRRPMEVLREQGVSVTDVALRPDGRIDLESLGDALDDTVVLVSLAMVASEIGSLQPMGEIGKLIVAARADRQERGITTPLIFHTDAASAAGLQSLHVSRLGVDLMTFGAGKLYGPTGIAALYVRTGTPLAPMLLGGGQEHGRRAGTESITLCVGFARALVLAEDMRKSEVERLKGLRSELADLLRDIPGLTFNTELKHSLVNTLNVSVAGHDGEDLVLALDARGYAVATGAACAESSAEPSHVLLAIGRTKEIAQASLRISLGRQTTHAQIVGLSQAIRAIMKV